MHPDGVEGIHMNINDLLVEALLRDSRLTSGDGQLLKNKTQELAQLDDPRLLEALLDSDDLKSHFFKVVGSTTIFLKDRFMAFVSSKEWLPDSFTEYKNRIGLTQGGQYLNESKQLVLAWPYKDCILEADMSDEEGSRNEVFFNEVLAPDQVNRLLEPKVLTGFIRYGASAELEPLEIRIDKNGIQDNLIVKGNNLLALSSLKEIYRGKVKCIYIDPPFNTNDDGFEYNDRFKTATWLTFMKNRLEIAKELLSEDGALFLHISDVRVNMVRLILDEIFGEQNFANLITVKTRSPSGFKTVNAGVFEVAEYIYVYAKNKQKWAYNTQYVPTTYDTNYRELVINPKDSIGSWKFGKVREVVAAKLGFRNAKDASKQLPSRAFEAAVADFAIEHREAVFRYTTINHDAGAETLALKRESLETPGKVLLLDRPGNSSRLVCNGQEIYFYSNKVRELDGKPTPTMLLTNIWSDIPYEGIASEGSVVLKRGKKPEKLLRRVIEMSTLPGDLVCDFFLGSGTTAAVAHKLGRRYLGIEQLDYIQDKAVPRLRTVIEGRQDGVSKVIGWKGGGDFVYCELKESNPGLLSRITSAKADSEIEQLWTEINKLGSLSYSVKASSFQAEASEFKSLTLDEKRQFLVEVLDKNSIYVNLGDLEDEGAKNSPYEVKANQRIYGVV